MWKGILTLSHIDSLLILATWEYFPRPIWYLSHLFLLQAKELIPGDRDGGYQSLLMAIRTARTEMFEVIMAALIDKLTEEEVSRCTVGDGGY